MLPVYPDLFLVPGRPWRHPLQQKRPRCTGPFSLV